MITGHADFGRPRMTAFDARQAVNLPHRIIMCHQQTFQVTDCRVFGLIRQP